MVDRQQLTDTLRRLRKAIRSDPELLARIDRNGDGNIDGAEWDRARRAVIRKLEARIVETNSAEDVAREVYEQELRKTPGEPPRIDACDHLILECEVDLKQRTQFGLDLVQTLRAGKDRTELACFEQLTVWLSKRSRARHDSDGPMVKYAIRPIYEDPVNLRRRPTMLGEELEVLSLHGRTIAHVRPRSRGFRYVFDIRGEDGRTLMLERKPWDQRCERSYRRTSGEQTHRKKKPPPPYHIVADDERWTGFVNRELYFPDEKDKRHCFRQWVVRLEEDSLNSPLRWGLIGALAFVLQGPSLLRGWLWDIF